MQQYREKNPNHNQGNTLQDMESCIHVWKEKNADSSTIVMMDANGDIMDP